jgi:hypothetical protein
MVDSDIIVSLHLVIPFICMHKSHVKSVMLKFFKITISNQVFSGQPCEDMYLRNRKMQNLYVSHSFEFWSQYHKTLLPLFIPHCRKLESSTLL